MKNPTWLIQILPILTITLCIVFFIIYKILSRIKNQAKGVPDSTKSTDVKLAAPSKMPVTQRVKLECPAIIERPHGFTRVGIKEITLNGAFVTCPRPLAVGETFQIKIIMRRDRSLTLTADVLWNNDNVPQDQIIARGMRVRFLQLSEAERQAIEAIVAAT